MNAKVTLSAVLLALSLAACAKKEEAVAPEAAPAPVAEAPAAPAPEAAAPAADAPADAAAPAAAPAEAPK